MSTNIPKFTNILLIYQFINMEETIDNIINNFDTATNRVKFWKGRP